jgi:hypothetical protein
MWRVEGRRRIGKQLASAPGEIQKRHEKWPDIAIISGPPGLRAIRGFHRYQVIYRALFEEQLFQVVEVTPHDYKKR